MKTFKDLVFKPHPLAVAAQENNLIMFSDAIQAVLQFDNDHSVSVIGGGGAYGDGVDSFELALFGPNGEWTLEGQVMAYLTKDEVTELMLRAQNVIVTNRNINRHKMI